MDHLLRNIKLLIAYDGTEFSGWQRQKQCRTIQGEIEACINKITQEKISLHGAGRTDAGVHAEEMIAHFKTSRAIPAEDFSRSLNSMLPGAIRILAASEVDDNFHARYSAVGKQYRYTIFTGKIQPPSRRLYSLHVRDDLNLLTVRKCLEQLEGTHDFSSFENSGSRNREDTSGRGAVRTIFQASLSRTDNDLLMFDFTGDGFLRNMVRNMVGSLLDSGRERLSPDTFGEILRSKNRTLASPTAPPHGLSLIKVLY